LAIKQLPAAISRPSACPPVSLFQLISSSKSLIFLWLPSSNYIFSYIIYLSISVLVQQGQITAKDFIFLYISNQYAGPHSSSRVVVCAACSLYPQKVCFSFSYLLTLICSPFIGHTGEDQQQQHIQGWGCAAVDDGPGECFVILQERPKWPHMHATCRMNVPFGAERNQITTSAPSI
jgi:hypothetical protein